MINVVDERTDEGESCDEIPKVDIKEDIPVRQKRALAGSEKREFKLFKE